jgi:hypothetical protein
MQKHKRDSVKLVTAVYDGIRRQKRDVILPFRLLFTIKYLSNLSAALNSLSSDPRGNLPLLCPNVGCQERTCETSQGKQRLDFR